MVLLPFDCSPTCSIGFIPVSSVRRVPNASANITAFTGMSILYRGVSGVARAPAVEFGQC